MELYPRLYSQIRQTWRYKVTIACTHTMLQMHIFNLDCASTHENHGKNVRALEHDHSISNRFSEWRRPLTGSRRIVLKSSWNSCKATRMSRSYIFQKNHLSQHDGKNLVLVEARPASHRILQNIHEHVSCRFTVLSCPEI